MHAYRKSHRDRLRPRPLGPTSLASKLAARAARAVACGAILLASCSARADYLLDTVAAGGNVEYRFLEDGFQFGTLIADPQGRLIFRAHPDQQDANGWGTSYLTNPFLSGADGGQGTVDNILTTPTGVEISTSGSVNMVGDSTYGTWSWQASVSYDSQLQQVAGQGTLTVSLPGTLAAAGADLNLDRLASNFLHDVPLQTGGVGDTGDTTGALVNYAPAGDPRDFTWFPPDLPSHFPYDFSSYLKIELPGTVNTVDTLALGEGFQIDVARKPTFSLAFTSTSPQDQMIAGLVWDESQGQNFAADNIGANHLVLSGTTDDTQLSYDFQFAAVLPVPEPSSGPLAAMGLLALGSYRLVRRPRRDRPPDGPLGLLRRSMVSDLHK